MPANRHLNWFEITDFTPGVFGETVMGTNQLLMPVNGFAKLLNYVPMKQGGARAFYAVSSSEVTCSGRSSTSNTESAVALFAHGAPAGDNIILVTHNGNDHKDRVYLFKGNCGASSWCVANVSAAAGDDITPPVDFQYFQDTNNIHYYLLVLRGQNNGLYAITYREDCAGSVGSNVDGYTQVIDASKIGPISINGARVIQGDGAIGAKLWWTAEGNILSGFPTDNHGVFSPNHMGAGFRGIISMQPDSFIIMRGDTAPWLQFNGDVGTTGTNRDMGTDHTGRDSFQKLCRVPGGVAFIEPGGHIYVTDGNSFTDISPQLPAFSNSILGGQSQAGNTVTGPGQLTFINGFLFAPDGKVLHWDTMSWFQIADSTAFTAAAGDNLYYVLRTDGSPVRHINMFQGDNALRSSTGTIQTAPYADKNGRNVEIREAQVFIENYSAGTVITADLIDGTDTSIVTRTSDAIAAGRSMVRFLFPSPKSKYLSLRLTIDSGNTAHEAPTVERIRIGFGQNNEIAGA